MRDMKEALDARRLDSLMKGTPFVLEVELVTHQAARIRELAATQQLAELLETASTRRPPLP